MYSCFNGKKYASEKVFFIEILQLYINHKTLYTIYAYKLYVFMYLYTDIASFVYIAFANTLSMQFIIDGKL